eukprot:TRINITY_DN1287_c0_g2_i16.p1 TRINITY_DN1287_c0_g2~~TRINITY_DN1287_c0_g2_i16.p1  ORF type:complete len:121 (-),score=20.36 TRINITY_DN1287_c0_g2_i16:134-496(-)
MNNTGHTTISISIPWFLATYGPPKVREFLKHNPKPQIYYLDYNWNLNGNVTSLCNYERVCFPWWGFFFIALFIFGTSVLLIYKKMKGKKGYQPMHEQRFPFSVPIPLSAPPSSPPNPVGK